MALVVFTTLVIAPIIPYFIEWNLKKISVKVKDDHPCRHDSLI